MGSATIAGILHRVEVTQVLTKERRIPWFAVFAVATVIALCFLFGCWQRLEAMRFNYENQKWEATRRELTQQRERLLLERSSKESTKKLFAEAERLGMVTRSSTLVQSGSALQGSQKPVGGGAPND